MEENKVVQKREDKIKKWFSVKYNLALTLILIVAFAIRFYFYLQTQNQPLWWDESEYMSAAKSFAGIGQYHLSTIRLPGFPLMAAAFFFLGIQSEPVIRFFLLFLPSIILIFLTYRIMSEMYSDKRIALISTAILSVLWESLFYSNRFHTENISLIFEFLAIFILFKCYMKKENAWFIKPKFALPVIALFIAACILIRPGNIIFIPALLAFIPILNYKFIVERKKISYPILIILLLGALFILFNLKNIPIISVNYHPENPIVFKTLEVFYGFYQPALFIPGLLFYFFLFGIILSLFYFWIKLPLIKNFSRNKDNLDFKSDIFNALLIISVLGSFIFLLRTPSFEFRWFFAFLPGMFAFTGIGLTKISDYFSKVTKSKGIVGFIFIVLFVVCLYGQFTFSKSIIENKKESYLEVKEAGLWLKENSNNDDVVITSSVPQISYYSERKVYDFTFNSLISNFQENVTAFNQEILKSKPRYLILSAFEPVFTPKWAYSWPNETNSVISKAYFQNNNQKQPILIIYELKYEGS